MLLASTSLSLIFNLYFHLLFIKGSLYQPEEYLVSHGLKGATYSISAAQVNAGSFGRLVACPSQDPYLSGASVIVNSSSKSSQGALQVDAKENSGLFNFRYASSKVAEAFLHNVVKLHGFPKTLVSNRDKKDKFLLFKINHVLREYNSEADIQANRALNLQAGQVEEDCDSN
ncbi:hypothetical protein P8452_54484 [Trifolium repens]|nr:hypothetical protein P8452_54484 [Trifolium repens]